MFTDGTGENVGLELGSRTDGGSYTPKLRKKKTKLLAMLRDLLFADDCTIWLNVI